MKKKHLKRAPKTLSEQLELEYKLALKKHHLLQPLLIIYAVSITFLLLLSLPQYFQ